MKLSDMALKEYVPDTLLGKVMRLLGFRYVIMSTPYHSELFAVYGVPPWRELTVKDIYEKKSVSLSS